MADAADKLRRLLPESLQERFGEVVDKIGDSIARVKAGRKYDLIDPKYGPYENAPVHSDDGTVWYPDRTKRVINENTGNTIGYAKNKMPRQVHNAPRIKQARTKDRMAVMPPWIEGQMPGVMEDTKHAMPERGMGPDLIQM